MAVAVIVVVEVVDSISENPFYVLFTMNKKKQRKPSAPFVVAVFPMISTIYFFVLEQQVVSEVLWPSDVMVHSMSV